MAQDGDLGQVREIARAYGGLVHWPVRPDYLDHERETGRLLVAVEDDRVVGFGGILQRDAITHLGDLFIRPDRVGRGLGSALLDALFRDARERVTFASSDPRAVPLYIRFGMRPLWPLLYLRGDRAAAQRLPAEPFDLVPATVEAIAECDRHASGRFRPQDLQFLAQAGTRFLNAPSLLSGYGGVRVVELDGRPHAFIGPSGTADESEAIRLLIGLARLAAELADHVSVVLLGPHPAVPALIGAGFRLVDRDLFMSSGLSAIDATRYVPSPEMG